MDFDARGEAYRGLVVRCPGCGEPMRAEPVPSAEVDVCGACGGLWIDWFDGDVSTLAAEAEAARVERGTPVPQGPPVGGSGICPRCTQQLVLEEHRFPDARPGELVDHVELLRCTECAGSWISRSSAHLLLDRTQSPPAVGLWLVLVDYLKRLVARRDD